MLVNESQLDNWVRGNARDAQGLIVELVARLVAASVPRPRERRFPLGDSIGQHGPDGVLDTELGFDPFVPEGRSYWEIGTSLRAGDKATADYNDLVDAIPAAVRAEATFVFVTPLSGSRDWEHTWKEDAQARWLENRRESGNWKDVRVIDGTKLIDWVDKFRPVELWLAQRTTRLVASQIEIPEHRWDITKSIGAPPPLVTQLFLANRDEACKKMAEIFANTSNQLKLDTRYPDQAADFVCAYLANLDEEARTEAAGRCLIVSGLDAWKTIVTQDERHVLVADSTLDLTGDSGTTLIQKARQRGHAVIFGGSPGGIPDPTRVALPSPRVGDIKEALVAAGYGDERARALAQKSGGNLGSLLRCLQNLSVLPAWADNSTAAELVIANFLGEWDEGTAGDREIVEGLVGNSYGEWIGRLREAALRPGTPLTYQNGQWKFVPRFEGWYALGPRVFDEQLDRLRQAAVAVLEERDPQLDLPNDDRFAAGLYGKVLTHSDRLRRSLAEALALLGTHPAALTSCSPGKAEATPILSVRALLDDADWARWASLNDLLPLLAEAAPTEFLACVERTLDAKPEVFDGLFAQEGAGIMGRTYIAGLLWALETLAWDPALLGRVVISLGALAARDPGGKWTNRPANSLRDILLPWYPQTTAPVPKRAAAIRALAAEYPKVGWKLLLSLLPEMHSSSSGTNRPAWRSTIPDEWTPGATHGEYWEQVGLYGSMAAELGKRDPGWMGELLDHWEHLPPATQDDLRAYLESDAIRGLSDEQRQPLWDRLLDIVTKHRRFREAEWAMDQSKVDSLAALAERVAPSAARNKHRRLFSERGARLYQERGNYEEQHRRLEIDRSRAVSEVAQEEGVQGVVTFATTVEAPWRVGFSFGGVADASADALVLPRLLESDQKGVAQFAGGFVLGRFARDNWSWVDGIDATGWRPEQIGLFLSFLPFAAETWDRAASLLGDQVAAYWSRAAVNAHQAQAADLERAVRELLVHGRPRAAIQCIHRMLDERQDLDPSVMVEALLASPGTSEESQAFDPYANAQLIKALQEDARTSPDDLFRVEWLYLAQLDGDYDAWPKYLGNRLATDAAFFCEVIRLVFASKDSDAPAAEPDAQSRGIATNAYRLLSDWRIPPGQRADGSYDGAVLRAWLEAVKAEASATGHLEIAMTMVGQVLTHVPADPDGLWIHRAAAEALNARDASDLRGGFRTQVMNSRGMHWVDPTGKPEGELAAKYRQQADAAEDAGYPRLATTMREVSTAYDREAERIRSRAQAGD